MLTWNKCKLICFMLFAVVLTACKPEATFKYAPDEIKVGQEVKFDATASQVAYPDRGNFIINYEWDFGDGVKTQTALPSISHTYNQVGDYTVNLTIVDYFNQETTVTQQVSVKKSNFTFDSNVRVQSVQGIGLADAVVSIGKATAKTDSQGIAHLSVETKDDTDVVVVSATLDGFVPQSIQLPAKEAAQALLVMLPIADSINVNNIENKQLVALNKQSARLAFDANTFAKTDGTVATGKARIEITPWDISSKGLTAMLGNGDATDAEGKSASLISAGMMTVNVYDAENNKLNVAKGKTATIQMDLPYANIAGNQLTLGSEIPLWSFHKDKGVWLQEGKGIVVASSSSPVKLAVKAEVAHFSTWSWDFKADAANNIVIKCQQANKAVPCDVVAEITHEGGARSTKVNAIPTEGTTITRVPNNVSIKWLATGADGAQAELTTTTQTLVTLSLEAPKTRNFVKCELPNGDASACHVTLSATTDSGKKQRNVFIPAKGAYVSTLWNTTLLNWEATTIARQEGSELFRYAQSVTSDANKPVEISLEREVVTDYDKTLYLTCSKTAISGEETELSRMVMFGVTPNSAQSVSTALGYAFWFDSGHIQSGTEMVVKIPANILVDQSRVFGLCVAQPNDKNFLPVPMQSSFDSSYKYYGKATTSANDVVLKNQAGLIFNLYSNIPDGLKATLTYDLNQRWSAVE